GTNHRVTDPAACGFAPEAAKPQAAATLSPHKRCVMWLFDNQTVPSLRTPLPGPKAQALLERDQQYVSPSYTRAYPRRVERGGGAATQVVDGTLSPDCPAGIAVTSTGHCHPQVVAAIKDQADKLLHMSGTDFYYQPQIDLAERLAQLGPGPGRRRVF